MINRKFYNINRFFVGLILIMFVVENFYRDIFVTQFSLTINAFPKIWQFVTYAFVTGMSVIKPGFSQFSIIFFIFYVLITYWFGKGLEASLGSIRYLLFLLLTLIGESIIIYIYFKSGIVAPKPYTRGLFHLSLMMMFGLTFPKEQIYMFFVLRVRVIVLAIVYYLFFLFFRFGILSRPFLEILIILSIFAGSGLGIFVFKIAGFVIHKFKKTTGKIVNDIKDKKAITKGQNEFLMFNRIRRKLEESRKLSFSEIDYLKKIENIEAQGNICLEEDFEPETELCKTCEDYKVCIKRFLKNIKPK